MAKLVNLPNGSQGSFPDDMPWEQIEAVVQKQFPVEQPKDNRNLLQKAGGVAQKYINDPLQDIGNQALSLGAGAAQGVANTGVGVRNLLAKGANLLPGVNIPMDKVVDIAPNNINSLLGQFGGSMLGGGAVAKGAEKAMEIPKHIQSIPTIANAINKIKGSLGKSSNSINKIMKFTKDIGKNAIAGAAVNPEDQGLGALFGGGGAAAGKAIGAAAPAIGKKLGIGQKPGRETLENINIEKIRPTIEAAKRQGINLTPGEASRSGYVGGQQGRYARTSKGAIEGERLSEERVEDEKRIINKFLTKVYDKSAASDNKINELYTQVGRWNLKEPVVNKLNQNTLIRKSIENVKNSDIWKDELKDINPNNVKFFDLVKRDLSSSEEGLKNPRTGKDTGESRQYKKSRKELEKVLDKAAPGYREARQEAGRKILRAELDKKIKRDEIKGSEFYNSIIKNDFEYKKLLKKVEKVPEAKETLEDMKLIFKDLINPPKASESAYRSSSSLNQARTNIEKAIQMWDNLFNKERNYESVKFIHNMDQWTKELQQARASGSKSRTESVLSDILGKAFSSGLNVTKEGLKE